MKQDLRHSVFFAAMLAIALAGCQKKEQAPMPETGAEAPAPMAEPAPVPPMEAAPAPMEAAPAAPHPTEAPSGQPAQ